MIWLWVAAALVSAAMAALIVQRAARAANQGRGDNAALAVYRRQMAELDELADRGLIAEGEKRSVRAETGRRLLAAAERTDPPLRAARPAPILIGAAAVPLAAVAVYLAVGAPGLEDQPFAKRVADWRAADPQSLTPPEMAAVLREIAAERPADPEPLRHLAVAELSSGAPLEAEQALQRAISLAPQREDLWEMLAETSVMAANGEVTPDAVIDFRKALALNPNAPGPRYYLARARIAGGDVAGGLADWRALAASLPPRGQLQTALANEIQQVSQTGKLADQTQPEAPPQVGPAQIQAMVDGLAQRLAAHPDDPAGWVRLVRAYTVLGETGRRDAALAEARRRFAGRAEVIAALDAATHPGT
jgi:cytochrome c-type biogenesis protein CcmH